MFEAITGTERNGIAELSTMTAHQNIRIQPKMIQVQAKVHQPAQDCMELEFTLSLACFVFFFIGAPLGAIFRKGDWYAGGISVRFLL